jgi:uncharacterized protein (TIGR03435 family)
MPIGLLAVFSAAMALAQNAADQPAFEVASIRPSPAGPFRFAGGQGGPGSKDPGIFRCEQCTIPMMVGDAYGVRDYQIISPSWMDTPRFEVNAKVPAGTTKKQFREMQKNLLAERFQLKLHHEMRDLAQYELVVAKSGPKFNESEPPKPADPAANAVPGAMPKLDENGFPVLPKGRGTMMTMMAAGRATYRAERETIKSFADTLSYQLRQPVVDLTGLTGRYDFNLSWIWRSGSPSPAAGSADGPLSNVADMDAGWTLESAVQSQLGLKLVAKKAPLDVIVLDHAEKVPSEN